MKKIEILMICKDVEAATNFFLEIPFGAKKESPTIPEVERSESHPLDEASMA